MKVKDLISTLTKLDQDANVYIEAYNNNEVNYVKQYNKDDKRIVYIMDDSTYIDEEMEE